jgi:hypothetical protein
MTSSFIPINAYIQSPRLQTANLDARRKLFLQ